MNNWIKQGFSQSGIFAATGDKSRFGILPGLILDFSLFPGLFISDDLDIADNFTTIPAMVRMGGEDEWEYEFIQAKPVHEVDAALQQGEQVVLAYDNEGLYFHPMLVEKIQDCPPLPRLHRRL